jgi:hypothetical protein
VLHLEPGLVEAASVPELRAFVMAVKRQLGKTLEAP